MEKGKAISDICEDLEQTVNWPSHTEIHASVVAKIEKFVPYDPEISFLAVQPAYMHKCVCTKKGPWWPTCNTPKFE